MTKTIQLKNVKCQKVLHCKRGNTDFSNILSNSDITCFYFHIKCAIIRLDVRMQHEKIL